MTSQSFWRWCSAFIALACGIITYLSFGSAATAQQPIVPPPYTQNFDSLGTSATATLPANWRIDKQGTVRTIGSWAAAVSTTELRDGNNMATNAGNGIYNYGAGDPALAPDRAVGWISSGTGTASGNLYLYLQNNSLTRTLGSLQLAYDVEKYRNGSNVNGFRIQLFYSYDGSIWFTAGAGFLTSFAADAATSGFASAPGLTVTVSNRLTFASPVSPTYPLYLAWNYSVASGSTTTNAQGLGIDNVQILSPLTPNAVTVTSFSVTNGDPAVPVIFLTGLASTIAAVFILRHRSRPA